MNEKVPGWLRKPRHKKEVIATNKGWVVKDTNEVLVSVLNLDKKLDAYLGKTPAVEEETVVSETVTETTVEPTTEVTNELTTEVTSEDKQEVEVVKTDVTSEDKQEDVTKTDVDLDNLKDNEYKSDVDDKELDVLVTSVVESEEKSDVNKVEEKPAPKKRGRKPKTSQ